MFPKKPPAPATSQPFAISYYVKILLQKVCICRAVFCHNVNGVLTDGLLKTSQAEFFLDHQQLGMEN